MGALKYLIVTRKNPIINLQYLNTLKGILSFHKLKCLEDLEIPCFIVSKNNVEFLNIPVNNKLSCSSFYINEVLSLTLHVVNSKTDFKVKKITELLALKDINSLLFNTFCAFLILHNFAKIKHINLQSPVNVKGINLTLWEILFLPCSCYAVLKETEKAINYNLEVCREPVEAANTVLSYLLSCDFFNFLLKKSLNLIESLIPDEFNPTESHCSLYSHTGEFRKSGKSLKPLKNFSLIGVY